MARRNTPKVGTLEKQRDRFYYKVKLPGTVKRKSYPLRQPGQANATTDRRMAIALADAMYKRAEKQDAEGGPEYDGSVTRLAELFLVARKKETASRPAEVRDKDYRFYDVTLRDFIKFLKCKKEFSLLVSDLKANRVLLWRESLSLENKLCRTTVNKKVNVVKQMLEYAAKHELETAELSYQIGLVKPIKKGEDGVFDRPEVEPADWGEVQKLFPYLHPMIRDMLTVARHTGARPGEVRLMRPVDIDRTDPQAWLYVRPVHKTSRYGHDRTIVINGEAQSVLAKYLVRPEKDYCFPPLRKRKGVGDHYTSASFAQVIHRCVTVYNQEHPKEKIAFHANQLRHTFGSEVCATSGMKAAQCVLGHTTEAMTRRYTRTVQKKKTLETAIEAVKKLG